MALCFALPAQSKACTLSLSHESQPEGGHVSLAVACWFGAEQLRRDSVLPPSY